MSSFSSVIRKSGASVKPKATPRRSIPRRNVAAPTEPPPTRSNPSSTLQDHDTSNTNLTSRGLSIAALEHGTTPEKQLTSRNLSPAAEIIPDVRTSEVLSLSNETSARIGRVTRSSKTSNEFEVAVAQRQLNADSAPEPLSVPTWRQSSRTAPSTTDHDHAPDQDNAIVTAETGHGVQTASPARKRRRITPRALTTEGIPQPTISASSTAGVMDARTTFSLASSDNQPPDDLLQSATQHAASVSDLANSIEAQTRARRSLRNVSAEYDNSDQSREQGAETTPSQSQKPSKRKRKSALQKASEVIANAFGGGESGERRRRQRDMTPNGAELYQIEPDEVTMGELTQDRRLGKKSQLEEDMQRDWADIVQRRKEAQEQALENAQKGRRKAFGHGINLPLQATIAIGPRTEIRNGKIVVVEESRQIDRGGAVEQAAVLDAENVREDKFYYKRVNQNTVGVKPHAVRKFRWDEEATELFFRGLQMFGTDFMMIANMFPGLDRKQVKMKFIREENADKTRVRQALADRIPVDLEEYAKVTDTSFQNPADVNAEIMAEEQRLREEDKQRRIREGFVSADTADNPIPTTEGNDAEVGESIVDSESRYAAMAEEIMAPKKRQRKAGLPAKKRGPRAGRQPAEGIEEILGSIDEVRV